MNYFFHSENLLHGSRLTLSEDEGRHAIKVLRSSIGDSIHIINGKGQLAEAVITNIKGNNVEVAIENVKFENKPGYELVIGLAILKKRDRLEWFVEKAIELAANRIILFNSQYTEKTHLDTKRLQKIAISASKQSGNLWMPEISCSIDFHKVISENFSGEKYIAHCREDGRKQLLNQAYKSSESALVLIGPEGDFSESEIRNALENNFYPVSLGNLRLRAETAALTALMMLQIANQDK